MQTIIHVVTCSNYTISHKILKGNIVLTISLKATYIPVFQILEECHQEQSMEEEECCDGPLIYKYLRIRMLL